MSDFEKRCFIIVEDEYYLARDVTDVLRRAGAEVMGPFPRERDALVAMQIERPDCAILDINTGDGPSFTLADTLTSRGVPFLFFTGYDDEVIPARFAGVPRLEKPVDHTRLVSVARGLCSAPSPPS
jgi:DNA-binding response OmpR family regulator